MLSNDQGLGMQVSDPEAYRPEKGRANLARLRRIPIWGRRIIQARKQLEDMPPCRVYVQKVE